MKPWNKTFRMTDARRRADLLGEQKTPAVKLLANLIFADGSLQLAPHFSGADEGDSQ